MSVAAHLSGAAYWLPLIAAGVVAVAIALYVILDGFDLGVGILFPFYPRESDRDQMMNSIAPFWDGNETWLILGGNGLLVAFPPAYAIIMPALYVPLIVMLLALVFRGVAFEFRWVAKPSHRIWDWSFAGGSFVAALAQGAMLAGLIQGIHVEGRHFAGGPLDWATPFALLCAVSLAVGYALLGACWLAMKTADGEERVRARARGLLIALIVCIGVVSVWTPLAMPRIEHRWFDWPNILYLAPVPLVTTLLALGCWRGIVRGRGALAFYCAIGLFLAAFAGLLVSNLPYLVPPALTLWQAAAAPKSQAFLLAGTALLLPFILGYTVFVYHTFRGKVRVGEGYH
jgi:cytochrome d ubiquinol oxidase subunit II